MGMSPTIGSLCTGFGGLEMGVPGRPIWHAEVDPDASRVLAARWPTVPNLGDIIGRNWSATTVPDILTAGFPCQPVSAAGRQLAEADPRWLWPAVSAAVEALRPPIVFLENVRNIVSIQSGAILDLITADLRRLGYSYRWVVMGACYVGAPHHRHRWFLRADRLAPGQAWSGGGSGRALCGAPRGGKLLPTATARDGDGRGEGDRAYWQARATHRNNGMPLGAALTLLPSPRASDGDRGRGNPNQCGGRGDLMIGSAVQPERFGAFTPAVADWARIIGYQPPPPTELNGNGNQRLAPAFVEWMMGLPRGMVTDHTSRSAALRILGNGVVPRLAESAWSSLLTTPL